MTVSLRHKLVWWSAVALATAAMLAAPARVAAPVQGSTAGKAKQKVQQAQAAEKSAGAAAGQTAATPSETPTQAPPASTPPAAGQTMTPQQGVENLVDPEDPNHMSAIKALEQIRRDEMASQEGSVFSYDPGDRRDPFLSPQDILQRQIDGQSCQGEGMECWMIQDVTVIGVLARRSGDVALVIGPDGYGTTLKEGDRLYDGEVRRIDTQSGLVVFRQKVNDPTRIKPFRDIEKGLNLNKEGRS
jgi:Tfp pilus assembly protein PilP